MNTTHKPVGYTYHADIYCADCGEQLPEIDPEGNEKHPVFSWETSELCYSDDGEIVPVTCGECLIPAIDWA